jgi:peptide/nickel transport system substrate-binding protein
MEQAPDRAVSAKSYTFTLRDGVTFSDGTPLDAAAVKTSFDGDAALLEDLPTAYGGVYIAGYAERTPLDLSKGPQGLAPSRIRRS